MSKAGVVRTIRAARTRRDIEEVRALLLDYAAWIKVDLCFQNFSAELAGLPGDYARPGGTLLILRIDDKVAGCIAVRKIRGKDCEMKRLFVRDAFRGHGGGRALALRAVQWARRAGYGRMFLDTLPVMSAAQKMYEDLGFVDTEPYRENPVKGARFMMLTL